jgi:hypothetical protein
MPSFIVSFLLIVSLVQETGKRSPHGDPENTAISTSTAAHAAAAITRFLSFAFFFIA